MRHQGSQPVLPLRLAALAALAVAAVVTVVGCAPRNPADFRLPTLDGRRLGPPDLRGQVVVVDFWASWCAPCHLQTAILERLREQYASHGVAFLAVNSGEDEETVRRFVADRPFGFPVLLDPAEKLSTRVAVLALPSLMIVDRDGEVSYFRAGIVPEKRLRELLHQAGGPDLPMPAPASTPVPTPAPAPTNGG
jgi:thiol-disulfide isomerase/thioredoxin